MRNTNAWDAMPAKALSWETDHAHLAADAAAALEEKLTAEIARRKEVQAKKEHERQERAEALAQAKAERRAHAREVMEARAMRRAEEDMKRKIELVAWKQGLEVRAAAEAERKAEIEERKKRAAALKLKRRPESANAGPAKKQLAVAMKAAADDDVSRASAFSGLETAVDAAEKAGVDTSLIEAARKKLKEMEGAATFESWLRGKVESEHQQREAERERRARARAKKEKADREAAAAAEAATRKREEERVSAHAR